MPVKAKSVSACADGNKDPRCVRKCQSEPRICLFVDVISVSAVLYIINFANCYQNGPKKLEKKLKKEEKVKKAITIEKKSRRKLCRNMRVAFV
jgi:hypothetical protein